MGVVLLAVAASVHGLLRSAPFKARQAAYRELLNGTSVTVNSSLFAAVPAGWSGVNSKVNSQTANDGGNTPKSEHAGVHKSGDPLHFSPFRYLGKSKPQDVDGRKKKSKKQQPLQQSVVIDQLPKY